ncbi:MAG: MM0924 family protein [Promethearchaeota archaeon]
MDKFISEHLLHKKIDVFIEENQVLTGVVIASADRVLTIQVNGKYIYINIDQVKYIMER